MNMDYIHRFLRNIYHDKSLVEELINNSQFLDVPAHTRILDEEKYVKVVPLVYEGRIKVMRKFESGKEILLYYINPGESCALSVVAGLTGTKSVAYAETETATKMFAIPIEVSDQYTRVIHNVLIFFCTFFITALTSSSCLLIPSHSRQWI